MKIKTDYLIGPALDCAVAKCEGTLYADHGFSEIEIFRAAGSGGRERYSTDWSQGGPIIEREKIALAWAGELWQAANSDYLPCFYEGHNPLIAAMRCYVASKLGDEVDVPEELL